MVCNLWLHHTISTIIVNLLTYTVTYLKSAYAIGIWYTVCLKVSATNLLGKNNTKMPYKYKLTKVLLKGDTKYRLVKLKKKFIF